MADEATVFELEEDGRLVEPEKLAAFLREADGKPVKIDACKTPIITSMHLQLHVAAEEHWAEQNVPFELVNTSEQFQSCLALLGYQQNA